MGWAAAFTTAFSMAANLTAADQEAESASNQARKNQALANRAAADSIARAGREASLARMKGTNLIGEQRMGYVAGGVDATVGSAAQVQGDARYYTELDARTIENNAAREAWGYRNHGLNYQTQAAMAAQRAANQRTATILGGTGNLLNAGSQLFTSESGLGGYGGESGYRQSELDEVWGED